MRLIFLDIDGVLDSDLWFKATDYDKKKQPLSMFSPKCVQLLNKILRRSEAKIVISSNWRLNHSLEDLRQLFSKLGVLSEIIDVTPDLCTKEKHLVRGNEILHWCQANEHRLGCPYTRYKDYIILDDNTDMLYWHRKNFFRTDRYAGLTPTVVQEVLRFWGC